MIENNWLQIALYPGCVQGYFLAYLLWKKKDTNRDAVWYFNGLLLMMATLMLLRVTWQPVFFKRFAEVILLPDVVLFLTGPFIFMFTRALLRLPALPRQQLMLHFIPAAIHVFLVNSFLGLHLNGTLHYLTKYQILTCFYLIELGAWISMAVYLTASWLRWSRYATTFYQKFSAPLLGRFLTHFFYICSVLLLIWGISLGHKYFTKSNEYNIYTLFWVFVVAAIYFLAYKMITTPSILALPSLLEPNSAKTSEISIPMEEIAALSAYMETKQPFRDPEMKLADLAALRDLPRHQLSKIINQGFQLNFFDFVNRYRVKAFIADRNNDAFSHLNTMELAYRSGFNSKSAFNRAFRKETGMSPKEFFERNPSHFAKEVD